MWSPTPSAVTFAHLEVVPMTADHAFDICRWEYPPPYSQYDMTGADPEELVTQDFFSLVEDGDLVGFRSFGRDGQVPGWDYDDSALDTGGGLRPDLVGRGLGRSAVAAGLGFGTAMFAPAAFRVTVASFNVRALRTVRSLGFRTLGRFEARATGRPFEVLVLPV